MKPSWQGNMTPAQRAQKQQQEQFQKQQEQWRRQQQMGAWAQQQEKEKKAQKRAQQINYARSISGEQYQGDFRAPYLPAAVSHPSCLARLARTVGYLILIAVLLALAYVAYSVIFAH